MTELTLLESIKRSLKLADLANVPVILTAVEIRELVAEVERQAQFIAVLVQHNSDEVDEYNAGHDAGAAGADIMIARNVYRDAHPNTPWYDVFDTGYIMGNLADDFDNFEFLKKQAKRGSL